MFAKFCILAFTCFATVDYKEITRKSYDDTAQEYQANTLKLKTDMKAQKFLSYLSPQAAILDLGCGPGRDAQFFAEKGFRVSGIDFSSQMIEIAKRNVPQAHFSVGDIEDLSVPKHSYDAV